MSSTTGLVNQDPFNIMKIYPDARRNPQWMTLPILTRDLLDPAYASRIRARLDLYDRLIAVTDDTGENITHYEIDNNVNGLLAFLTSGGMSSIIDCDTPHSTFSDRQYISYSSDWLNIEGTIFIQAKSFINIPGNDNPVITLKGRTGFHPKNSHCCQGCAYGCNSYVKTNIIELFREVYHDNKIKKDTKNQTVVDFYNNWFGLKFNIFNKIVNGIKQVYIELRICPSDLPDDMSYNWIPVIKRQDFTGSGWARGGLKCGANFDDSPIDFAGPRCIFQWSGFNKLIFKYASWREIDPYIGFSTGGHKGGRRPTIISVRAGYHYDAKTGTEVPDPT